MRDTKVSLVTEVSRDSRYRLAAALLLHYGELSLAEIEAIPFVDSLEVAELVADELVRKLGAERFQQRVDQVSSYVWEDFVRLPATTS